MSTDYFAYCNKCKKTSDIAYARQAWGWGNSWPKNLFSFLNKHTNECGEKYIRIVSEHHIEHNTDSDISEEYSKLRGFTEVTSDAE